MRQPPKELLERQFERSLAPFEETEKLARKAKLYRNLCLLLVGLVLAALAVALAGTGLIAWKTGAVQDIEGDLFAPTAQPVEETAPHAVKVREIMKGLDYSGLPMFLKKEVTLSLDFAKRQWTLQNIHRFDKDGNLILEGGKSGACGELAARTQQLIQPLFGNDYQIKYVRAAQSGFFLSPQASHIVLKITPKAEPANGIPQAFILDPSARRYGPTEQFEDYLFFESMPELPFVKYQHPDISFPVQESIPLLIENNYLFSFVVEARTNGAFDEKNFIIALTLTKRYHFAGRYVFALRMNNGEMEILENKSAAGRLLDEKTYQAMREKLLFLFSNVQAGVER